MRYEELTTEGRNAMLETLRSGKTIDKLFVLDGYQGGPACTILREARKYDTIISYVSKERLDQISETGKHQGVIAYAAVYEYAEVEDMLRATEEKREPPFLILLGGMKDPHSLRAVIRTASLAKAHGIIILKRRAVGLTVTVIRTSAGALNYTPAARVINLTATMEDSKKKGMWSACADMGGELMHKINLKGPIGLVVENGGKGVGKLMREHYDMTVSIPMKGDIDSLDASVAASVLAYETVRQRLEIQSFQRKKSDNDMKAAYKPAVKLTAAAAAVFFAVSSIRVPMTALVYTKLVGSHILAPVTSGVTTYSNEKTILDTSSVSGGHIMVKYTGDVSKIKVQITKSGSRTYTYDLGDSDVYEVFPLSEGNGSYSVKMFESIQGNQYSQTFSQNVNITITDQFGSLLYPNQYVNFNAASVTVQTGASVAASAADQSEVMSNVYSHVVNNIAYNTAKASSVQSGYLPNVDAVLAQKKGICFDYAALMTAMLRSQDIPTKLVVGCTGNLYHAWIGVYLKGQGWVNNIIYFGGNNWKLMNPTFTSSSGQNQKIMQYTRDGSNYRAKCSY